ncbi:MAG: hypothetical protein HY920_04415 [Elusimicrobia bacterium]|nr:hypothetical protein [Elusimicrobiota bacterium]
MKKKDLFSLFKIAIGKEQLAQKFYERMIKETPDPKMKKILEKFLNQERYHEEILTDMYAELKETAED